MLTERNDVLEQLRELGGLGRGDGHDLVADLLVDGDGALQAGGRDAADDLRGPGDRVVAAARVDPLRGIGEEEALADLETAALERRQQLLAGGPRIGGRLEHDELAFAEDPGDRLGRAADVGHVRLPLGDQRRRDADQDRVAVPEHGRVGRGGEAVPEARQVG